MCQVVASSQQLRQHLRRHVAMVLKLFYYVKECPGAGCTSTSWKKAQVWGQTELEARDQLYKHLTASSYHNISHEEASIFANTVDCDQDHWEVPQAVVDRDDSQVSDDSGRGHAKQSVRIDQDDGQVRTRSRSTRRDDQERVRRGKDNDRDRRSAGDRKKTSDHKSLKSPSRKPTSPSRSTTKAIEIATAVVAALESAKQKAPSVASSSGATASVASDLACLSGTPLLQTGTVAVPVEVLRGARDALTRSLAASRHAQRLCQAASLAFSQEGDVIEESRRKLESLLNI